LTGLGRHLSASQILLLAILLHFAETKYFLKQTEFSRPNFHAQVATRLGHDVTALIGKDTQKLDELGLFNDGGWSGSTAAGNAGLTDLGIKFCEYVRDYEAVKNGMGV
jgi:hypothetical protein